MSAEPRRVVVTGVGTVNALGAGGTAALAVALSGDRSGIAPIRAFPTDGLPSRLGAEVDAAALAGRLDPEAARRMSRICQLAVAACRLAVEDGAAPTGPDLGLVVGTEHGDFRSSEAFAAGYLKRGPSGLSPMVFPSTVMNAMGAAAAIEIGAKGPTVTVNQATVAGDLAVARGVALVVAGRAETVVAGGVDELYVTVHRQLARMGALSPAQGSGEEGCRPHHGANGPVPGEGATFVVLETLAQARARGARVLAEVWAARWGSVPVAANAARPRRGDRASLVRATLAAGRADAGALAACYGAANGDPALDAWEQALLEADLADAPAARAALLPPRALAPRFGQHGGLGALRVAAAALDVARDGRPVLAHGVARGGCRTALLLGPLR
jgi:3-oxoacyl-[acyl-carrier-protein] synthase II